MRKMWRAHGISRGMVFWKAVKNLDRAIGRFRRDLSASPQDDNRTQSQRETTIHERFHRLFFLPISLAILDQPAGLCLLDTSFGEDAFNLGNVFLLFVIGLVYF